MNIFRRLINRFRREYDFPEEFEVWEDVVFNRDNVTIDDREQRHDYVTGCLEQLKDATIEIDSLQAEYNIVTSQLKDMEEIEALPNDEMAALQNAATRLSTINAARRSYELQGSPMDDNAFQKIDALYDQIEDGVKKLQDAEEYQVKIKQDMKRLAGEKEAYTFRKHELQNLLEDLRAMMIIILTAAGFCVILLLILQFGFGMNTMMGYMLAAGVTAIAFTFIFFKNSDSMRDLKRVEKSINKIILLHNTVKIRYINNTNLLEYLHLKYGVRNSEELTKLYDQYLEDKKRREAFVKMQDDMDIAERDFLRILRRYRIGDPLIWLHQSAAILDKREMVEVRHKLIIRRQSLRKRMDYNKEVVAKKAQQEIKELVDRYPRYSAEILNLVDGYEKRYS